MSVAVVTGAAQGIGAAIATRLGAAGHDVVRIDLAGDEETVACDVADHRQVAEVAARVTAEVGPVDVLVNNAGIWRFGPLDAVDPVDFRRVLDVNVGGTFNCTQAFGRTMLDRGGSIVNIVSIAAQVANPAAGAYSPSKAAVLALTRQTALEWGPRGVRANAVGPGFVPTPGTAAVYDDPDVRSARAGVVPLRRLGDPADIAGVVAFLAGPDAAYVSGQVIYVDGGVTQSLMSLVPRPDDVPGPHIAR
jgi:NAD(P)-dependent dehydrogenase (short-subunit alcohol dehydrogenase family)